MNKPPGLFYDKDDKLSSKRVVGTILVLIAMFLLVDSHFSERELNTAAFSTALYTGSIMIIGGVLEKRIN